MVYTNSQLKGLILLSVLNDKKTPKEIFSDIHYKNNLDILHKELYILRRRGYLIQHKHKRVSVYDLTAKGRYHALNPSATLDFKRQRAERLLDALILNNPKTHELENKMRHILSSEYSRPIIRPPAVNEIIHGDTLPGETVYVPVSSGDPPNSQDKTLDFVHTLRPSTFIDKAMADIKNRGNELDTKIKSDVDCDTCTKNDVWYEMVSSRNDEIFFLKKELDGLKTQLASKNGYQGNNIIVSPNTGTATHQSSWKVCLAMAKNYRDGNNIVGRDFIEKWYGSLPVWAQTMNGAEFLALGFKVKRVTESKKSISVILSGRFGFGKERTLTKRKQYTSANGLDDVMRTPMDAP
jgi:hypothetical protein